MKKKSLIVFITHILAFLCICIILGCSVESSSGEEKPVVEEEPVVENYTVLYSSDYAVEQVNNLKPIIVQEGVVLGVEQLPVLSENGYTFIGWYDGETKVVAGVYKVTKNVTLVAKWSNDIVTYIVKHCQQNIEDDEYTLLEKEQLFGKTEELTAAVAKKYPGFTAQNITQTKIAADGSTVIKIYYDRKIINLTFKLDGGNIDGKTDDVVISGKYGAKASVPSPEKENSHFGGWSMDIPETFPTDDIEIKALWGNVYSVVYKTEKASTPNTIHVLEDTVLSSEQLPELKETGWIFEGWYYGEIKIVVDEYVVTKNVTLVAKWSPATVIYTVEHCQQNIEDDEYTLLEKEHLSGKTEELTAAIAKEYPGFTAQNITQTGIVADGSTVVKIYYDRKIINLIFKLDGGNIDGKTDDVVVSGKYGAKVSAPRPEKADCKFVGWDKEVAQIFLLEKDVFVAQYIGSFSITVNLVNWDASDLKITKSETDDFIYNITVPEIYRNISYYINNEKQEETSNDYKFEIPKRNGCFNLVVVAEKNSIKYSYSMNVVVDGLN